MLAVIFCLVVPPAVMADSPVKSKISTKNSAGTVKLSFQGFVLGTPMADIADKILDRNPFATFNGDYSIVIPEYSLGRISMDVLICFLSHENNHQFAIYHYEKSFENDVAGLEKHASVLDGILSKKFGPPDYHKKKFDLNLVTDDWMKNSDCILSRWDSGDRFIYIVITRKNGGYLLTGLVSTKELMNLVIDEYNQTVDNLHKAEHQKKTREN
jgi:hypothetical protein